MVSSPRVYMPSLTTLIISVREELFLIFFLPRVSNQKTCLHSSTPLYVVWLLNESWVEDGKCPICCVFNGWILELSSYSRSARMKQTAPICWPLQGKKTHSFSTCINIIISLHSDAAAQHPDKAPSKMVYLREGACQKPLLGCRLIIILYLLVYLLFFLLCN